MRSRNIQRGARLLSDCYKANITKHEYGKDDDRVFCYGLYGNSECELRDECSECGAHWRNAKPNEEVK